MDRLIYTAATGLGAHMRAQGAIANNLANISTTGYRADRVVFDRIELKGGGAKLEARAPTSEEIKDADRRPGAIQSTGRSLDVAMGGDAWIEAVEEQGNRFVFNVPALGEEDGSSTDR